MGGKKTCWWLALMLAAGLTLGCAELLQGVLMEKKHEDGRIERVRVDGTESWRSMSQNPMRKDDSGILLRNEITF